MPTYAHKCTECDDRFEQVRRMSEPQPESCDKCGGALVQLIFPINVMCDIRPYQSIVTGEWITSRKAHRDHLKANDLIEVGTEKPKFMREANEH